MVKKSTIIKNIIKPIYKNRGIIITHDENMKNIGVYNISVDYKYKSLYDISEEFFLRAEFLTKYLGKAISNFFGCKICINKKIDKEKRSSYIYQVFPETIILKNKESCFSQNNSELEILKVNEYIFNFFKNIDLKKLDDCFFNKIDSQDKKINLCISNQCFLKCEGCYNNFCYKDNINYEKISDFLDYAVKKGLKQVTLSGGDPLIYKDISKVIKKCIKLNLKVNLDTLGWSFLNDVKVCGSDIIVKKFDDYALLSKLQSIGIPLDGSNEKIISTFRKGSENIFEKQLAVLDLLEGLNVNVCINTVFHKKNISDIKNIFEIIKKYKCVKKWQIFQFMPIGPLGKQNELKFSVEIEQFLSVAKTIKNNSSELMIEFKPAIERSHNYMLVDSSGKAYKVDLDNNQEVYGNIGEKKEWDNIMQYLA